LLVVPPSHTCAGVGVGVGMGERVGMGWV
jgi:hypothetical protein